MELTNDRVGQQSIDKEEGTNRVDGLITVVDFAICSKVKKWNLHIWGNEWSEVEMPEILVREG